MSKYEFLLLNMFWNKIVGQTALKSLLKDSIEKGRISHTQLFIGDEGSGSLSLAIAYAQEILMLNENSNPKMVESLQHPDMHFAYPVATTETVKKEPTSKQFLNEWRSFVLEQPYANLYDWLQFLGVEKKQGLINVHESQEIIQSLFLNSYQGGYKVLIIWLPEKMNNAAANKLLKILEEPPKQTVFLLVSEQPENLLPTIISRCQMVKIPRLTSEDITDSLIQNYNLTKEKAKQVSQFSQGNYRVAIQSLSINDESFETYFIEWVRNAFMAKKKPAVLQNLVNWANEIGSWSREEQKQFLAFCTETFRQALLQNYQANKLVLQPVTHKGFQWDRFVPFIHGANIQEILEELNEAIYHIERNANAKIVFLDISIRLTRFLHRKHS